MLMRRFLENDLHRAERHVREAERHASRQKSVVRQFELAGDTANVRLARVELALAEKRLAEAKEALRRTQCPTDAAAHHSPEG